MDRPSNTKPFALDPTFIDGASRAEVLNANEEFQNAKQMHSLCVLYATAYNETMVLRMEKEKPEWFEENQVNKHEMIAHLTNNMCLKESKYKSKVFRNTLVDIKEKQHLQEQIRRLSNNGDRFHPYL